MMFLPMNLGQDALLAMTKDAERAFPNECCGFFYGHEEGGERRILASTAVENRKEGDQRRRFLISDLDYMRAERHAAKTGMTLLGVYHSHPLHPANPSENDLAVALPCFSTSSSACSQKAHTTCAAGSWTTNDNFPKKPSFTSLPNGG